MARKYTWFGKVKATQGYDSTGIVSVRRLWYPSSKFAADFFGFENIFAVKGSNIIGESGNLTVSFDTADGHLAWRPSAIPVGSGPYRGKVIGVSFVGEQREYVIEADFGQIKAANPATDPVHAIGTTVAFYLPKVGALHLPENGNYT